MAELVVDTDVVSFFAKNDTRFADYAPELDGKELILSFMTLAELYLWQELRNWGAARRQSFRICSVKNLMGVLAGAGLLMLVEAELSVCAYDTRGYNIAVSSRIARLSFTDTQALHCYHDSTNMHIAHAM